MGVINVLWALNFLKNVVRSSYKIYLFTEPVIFAGLNGLKSFEVSCDHIGNYSRIAIILIQIVPGGL